MFTWVGHKPDPLVREFPLVCEFPLDAELAVCVFYRGRGEGEGGRGRRSYTVST